MIQELIKIHPQYKLFFTRHIKMIQDMAIPQDDGATQVKAIQQQTVNAITNTQNLIEKKQPVNTQLVVKFDVQQLSRYSFQIITC